MFPCWLRDLVRCPRRLISGFGFTWLLSFNREVELLVEAPWLQRSQCFHPKILSAEEGQADLLFRHSVLVFYFFYYYDSEVLESVVWGAEMLIDLDRIVAFCIVPVLI